MKLNTIAHQGYNWGKLQYALLLGMLVFCVSAKIYASFTVNNDGASYDIDVTYGAIGHDEKYDVHNDYGEGNNHRVEAYSSWTKFDDHISNGAYTDANTGNGLWTEYYWNGVWEEILE